MTKNFVVTIKQFNQFKIEAETEEEAKDIATYNRFWDESDPNFDISISVKEAEGKDE